MPIVTDPVVVAAALPAPQYGFSSLFTGGGVTNDLVSLDWNRRTGVVWNEVEETPGSGVYDWSVLDVLAQNAITYAYGLFIVVKVGHHATYSEAACFAAANGSFKGDGESNRLVSCPIKSSYLVAWRNFIRAIIRRYGKGPGGDAMPGLTSGFQIELQIENEATSKKFWNIDITGDGKTAAENYIKVLAQAYLAKQLESATTKIILAGVAVPEKISLCTLDPTASGENCSIDRNRRPISFMDEVMRYPQYFDAVDMHLFSYQYFLPLSVPNAMAWLRALARKNGWNIGDKAVYACEWTPAFIKHAGAKTGGPDAMKAIYPYASDFDPVGYLSAASLYDSSGNLVVDGVPPAYFSGDYNGTNDRTFALLMSAANGALSPQQYQWTSNYTGINSTVWQGPIACATTPTLLAFGVSVTWDAVDGHSAPFAVAAPAHPDTDPVTIDTIEYYYENLDFLENDASLPANIKDPKHKDWFDAEEAIDLPKAYCAMLVEGIRKFVFIKFPNYFPSFSWDEKWWKFHGVIRYTGGTTDVPVWHKKPSYHAHNQFVNATAGFVGITKFFAVAGTTAYQFTFSSGSPVYMFWAKPTNTLDDPNYNGGNVALASVNVAFANELGWTTALASEFVTDLDASKNPVYTTYTVSGASTVSVGNIPLIVTKVA